MRVATHANEIGALTTQIGINEADIATLEAGLSALGPPTVRNVLQYGAVNDASALDGVQLADQVQELRHLAWRLTLCL